MDGIKVISTTQVDEMLPTGQTRTVYRAHVETDKGARGVLVVPKERWTKEWLDGLLKEKRDELNLAFVLANGEDEAPSV